MGDSSIEMKRQKRHVAGRDATGKLARHNGQDFQTFSGAICGGNSYSLITDVSPSKSRFHD